MKSRKMLLMSRVTLTVNHHLADTTAFWGTNFWETGIILFNPNSNADSTNFSSEIARTWMPFQWRCCQLYKLHKTSLPQCRIRKLNSSNYSTSPITVVAIQPVYLAIMPLILFSTANGWKALLHMPCQQSSAALKKCTVPLTANKRTSEEVRFSI
jgi:hypothetical protein